MDQTIVLSRRSMVLDTQTIYVFIPGKNWKLSLAEVVSFLAARNYHYEVCELTKAFFTVSVDEGLGASVIADLGGFIKIGRVAATVSTRAVEEAFLRKDREAESQVREGLSSSRVADEMLETASGKFVFGVSVYFTERSFQLVSKIMQRFLGSFVKHELAARGKRSRFMGFPRRREQPQLSHVEVLKKGLVERKAEILFCVGKERTVVSTTVAVHNPFEFQKRDVGKPKQRKIFAISPRLARIMVNLASCTSGKLLLDPFCGVGTILQEALLTRARVVGLDLNPWCIQATIENLEWLKKEYALKEAEYTILQGDARTLTHKIEHEVDCIATEPDLGPALRHVPTTPYATKVIDKLEPLYYSFLEGAYRILKRGGRLVLTTPYIRARSGKPVTMPIGEKAVGIGFKRVHPFRKEIFAEDGKARENLIGMASLVDAEKKHKIGREIHVFQK